ncbi:MAG: hypothetical protein V2A58_16560 [Planctomycetota bacterium]
MCETGAVRQGERATRRWHYLLAGALTAVLVLWRLGDAGPSFSKR